MAEILAHAAFCAGWPKAWAAFRTGKEVYEDWRSAQVERDKPRSTSGEQQLVAHVVVEASTEHRRSTDPPQHRPSPSRIERDSR